MQRDLALKVLAFVKGVRQALADLMDTMFIIYQPKDCYCNIGDTVSFNVVAMNVSAYQWQYRTVGSSGSWTDARFVGNNTANPVFTLKSESSYASEFTCRLTDADGNIIYSDIVRLYPNTEGS